jgi:hypothetical protein
MPLPTHPFLGGAGFNGAAGIGALLPSSSSFASAYGGLGGGGGKESIGSTATADSSCSFISAGRLDAALQGRVIAGPSAAAGAASAAATGAAAARASKASVKAPLPAAARGGKSSTSTAGDKRGAAAAAAAAQLAAEEAAAAAAAASAADAMEEDEADEEEAAGEELEAEDGGQHDADGEGEGEHEHAVAVECEEELDGHLGCVPPAACAEAAAAGAGPHAMETDEGEEEGAEEGQAAAHAVGHPASSSSSSLDEEEGLVMHGRGVLAGVGNDDDEEDQDGAAAGQGYDPADGEDGHPSSAQLQLQHHVHFAAAGGSRFSGAGGRTSTSCSVGGHASLQPLQLQLASCPPEVRALVAEWAEEREELAEHAQALARENDRLAAELEDARADEAAVEAAVSAGGWLLPHTGGGGRALTWVWCGMAPSRFGSEMLSRCLK